MALMCFYRIGRHFRGVTSKDDTGHVPGETEPGDAPFVKIYKGE
jgi:hypothetical protein